MRCLLTSLFITSRELFYLRYCVATKIYYSLFYLLFIHACVLYLSLNVVNVVNKFQTPVWGCTEIPGGECHRHEIWDKEKTIQFGCSDSNWGFWQQCWWMHRWIMAFPLCMHSGFPTERLEQMIVMWCLSQGLSSGFLVLNSWVYW